MRRLSDLGEISIARQDSVTSNASSLSTFTKNEATTCAGVLALAVARAAAASGTHHARLQVVLREVAQAMGASLTACYVASIHEAPRRVAWATGGGTETRTPAALARKAALRAAAQWNAALKAGDDLPHATHDLASPSPPEALALPLETGSRWVGLVVVWSDADAAVVHAGVLREATPVLALVIPPLISSAPRRTHTGDSRQGVRLDKLLESRGADPRDAMLAVLRHELRNPLNTLGGFLEIVLNEQVGPLNEHQRQFLEYARDSAQRIAQVVEQLGESHGDGEMGSGALE